MTVIYSNGTGGGSYYDVYTWAGGVVPLQVNGDSSYISSGDMVDVIPEFELCENCDGTISSLYGNLYNLNNGGYISSIEAGGYCYYVNGGANVGTVQYGGIIQEMYASSTLYQNLSGGSIYTAYNGAYIQYNFGFINNLSCQLDWNDGGGISYVWSNGYLQNNYGSGYIEENYGIVNDNGSNAVVNKNYYEVDVNDGYVHENYTFGFITSNYGFVDSFNSGIVYQNNSNGYVLNAPYGLVGDNLGNVDNYGNVSTNEAGGYISVSGDNFYVADVSTNHGVIYSNGSLGTVDFNDGIVTENLGNVTDNSSGGAIYYSLSTAIVSYNHGTIYRNDGQVGTNNVGGMIHKHDGTCTDNYGDIHLRIGSITTNYGNTAGVYFSSMLASAITDPSSGVTYGIASDAFSDPTEANVKSGINYQYNEDGKVGSKSSGGYGVSIVNF